MKNILFCLFLFYPLLAGYIHANELSIESISPSTKNSFQVKLDSMVSSRDSVPYLYQRGANGLIIMPATDWEPLPYNVSFRDTVIYDPAFLPVVFDGKILPPNMSFLPKDTLGEGYTFYLIEQDSTLAPLIKQSEKIQAQRRNFYVNMNNIKDVHYSLSELKSIPKLDDAVATKRSVLHDLITAEDPIQVAPIELEKIAPELKYWAKYGEHSLQVAQNHISDNWYKGGNSSLFVRNYHKLQLDYKKDKITFNNVLEWKLSMQQTPADSIHKVNISEDLLRFENTFGYKAFDHWSYSAKLESKTQLFSSYPVNSKVKNTALFAPLIINLGLGMSYTLDKKYEDNITKKLKLIQNIAPFSINYTYIADEGVDETKFGLDEDERSKFEIGSLINTDLVYTFNKFMTWTSRFKYFTNYHRVEVDFENKFDMSLNRYLSTNIMLYLRYDDNVEKGDQYGYLQVNELISFGLSYKW